MSMADHTEPLQIAPDPETLYTFHRQQLSAMLDGELSPDEARFMLRRLEHDVELARCWERWQLCGELLRGRADGLLPSDFAARVAASVQAPAPRPQARMNAPRRSRMMMWGGMGLAASVALAAVLVVNLPGDEVLPEPMAAATDIPVPAAMAETAAIASVPDMPATSARNIEIAVAATVPVPDHSTRAAHELLVPAAVVPVPVLPRPWPRAGEGAGAFSVGYGLPPMSMSMPMPMDPFQPRWAPPPSAFWPETKAPPLPGHGQSGQD